MGMVIAMQARTVGLIVAAALAAGWLIGGAGGGATSQDPSADRARGPRPLGSSAATVAPYTHKLRERMKDAPATPERGRNPFVYRPRAARPPMARSAPAETQAATPELAPSVPAAPMFRLSGIASNQQDGATVMTAIIIDNGVMVFAKAGDQLSGGHMVVRVDDASVLIADSAGITQTLRLP
jgi:hypothetical protein